MKSEQERVHNTPKAKLYYIFKVIKILGIKEKPPKARNNKAYKKRKVRAKIIIFPN